MTLEALWRFGADNKERNVILYAHNKCGDFIKIKIKLCFFMFSWLD